MPKNDPKNYHEDCAILHNTRADMPWHDLKCNTKLASICKKCADSECTSFVSQTYKCQLERVYFFSLLLMFAVFMPLVAICTFCVVKKARKDSDKFAE